MRLELVSIPSREFLKFQLNSNREEGKPPLDVSIPSREFLKFQRDPASSDKFLSCVSIPSREFLKFQLYIANFCIQVFVFQSLVGSSWNFNEIVKARVKQKVSVSIPSREFLKFQRQRKAKLQAKFKVSIPSREFLKFQLLRQHTNGLATSFNP